MNHNKRDTETTDRRHYFLVRGLSFIGAAALIILVLWSAGVSPTALFAKWPWKTYAAKTLVSAPVPGANLAAHTDARPQKPSAERIPGTDSSLSPVPLELFLTGTQVGRNSHEGLAFIGVDPLHPQTYLAGAVMENSARLAEIYRDHVVLTKGAHRATLYVHSLVGKAGNKNKADPLLFVGGPEPTIEARHLGVDTVSDYLHTAPEYDNGSIIGFQVYPGTQAGVFNQWGLKVGDVMIALDDVPLTNADQIQQQLTAVAAGATSTATVRRNGEVLQLTLDGALIAQLSAARAVPPAMPPPSP